MSKESTVCIIFSLGGLFREFHSISTYGRALSFLLDFLRPELTPAFDRGHIVWYGWDSRIYVTVLYYTCYNIFRMIQSEGNICDQQIHCRRI